MIQYNQTVFGDLALPISGFEIVQTGERTQLIVSLDGGTFRSIADLSMSGGNLTVSNVQSSSASSTLLPSAVSANSHLFGINRFGGGIEVAINNGASLSFDALETLQGLRVSTIEPLPAGAGGPILIVARQGLADLQLFTLNDGGNTLSPLDSRVTLSALNGAPVDDIAVATIGATQFAIAVSTTASTVVSVSIADDGTMQEVDQAGARSGVGIGAPTYVETLEIDGRHFAIVAAQASSSVTVFEIDEAGNLSPTDQINDSTATRFQSLTEADVIEANGRCFVTLSGVDGGVSLFQLLGDGILHEISTFAGDGTIDHGRITALETFVLDGTFHILTAAEGQDVLHRFSVDLNMLGDVFHAEDNGAAIGSAASDLLITSEGDATLTGGTGADTFVIGAETEDVIITDFEYGVDNVDLSFWPRLYDLSALDHTEISGGIRLQYGDRSLTIRTHNQSPLGIEDFSSSDFFGLWRIPVGEQNTMDPTLDNWTGTLSLRLGSMTNDDLVGTAGSEVLAGQGGNDQLVGLGGNDILFGGSGADHLTGGDGEDVFVFAAQDGSATDVVQDYQSASFNALTGELAGDCLFFYDTEQIALTTSGNSVVVGGHSIRNAATDPLLVLSTSTAFDLNHWADGLEGALDQAGFQDLRGTLYDLGNTQDYTTLTLTFDAVGRVASSLARNDNGSRTHSQFDPSDRAIWQTLAETVDTQGRRIQYDTVLDNGRLQTTLYDATGSRNWSTIYEAFNPQGITNEYMITYDIGTSRREITDTEETANWAQLIELRNENGTLYDKRTNYDVGLQKRIVIDTDITPPWDTLVEYRNAAGALYDKRTNYDNGLQQRLIFDVEAEEQPWDLISETRNSAGNLTTKRTEYDTGQITLLQLDAAEAASWASILQYFDADGSLTTKRTTYDDGRSLVYLFDTDNSESWDVYTRLFDADGTLLSETYL